MRTSSRLRVILNRDRAARVRGGVFVEAAGNARGLKEGARKMAVSLRNTKTESNLREAYLRLSQKYELYQYFALKADIDGYSEISTIFHSISNSAAAHARLNLEILKAAAPLSELSTGDLVSNIAATIADLDQRADVRSKMARAARDEGFEEIADWLETVVCAKRKNTHRFESLLRSRLVASA